MGTFNRRLADTANTLTKALPAAAATNYTDSIDTNNAAAFKTESVELLVSVPAIAAHTDTTKHVTIQLQESADDSSFAATTWQQRFYIPGVASTGTSAYAQRVRIPSDLKRYIRFAQTVDTGAGDLTGTTVTYTPYC